MKYFKKQNFRLIWNIFKGFIKLPYYLINDLMSKRRNQNEFRLFGLKRSGNHAFINWFSAQCDEKLYFLNNVRHFSDPFRTGYDSRVLTNCVNMPKEIYWIRRLQKKKYLFYSYEDIDIKLLNKKGIVFAHDKIIGKSKNVYNLIIIRDPFNLMASRFKKRNTVNTSKTNKLNPTTLMNLFNMECSEKSMNIWKNYAKEYLKITNYIKNKVFINYNMWVIDKKYREQLAIKLDLKFSDKVLRQVPIIGIENSFDGKKHNNNASKMNLFSRWENYKDDPEYLSLFRDEEIFIFADKIFGKILNVNEIKKCLIK